MKYLNFIVMLVIIGIMALGTDWGKISTSCVQDRNTLWNLGVCWLDNEN